MRTIGDMLKSLYVDNINTANILEKMSELPNNISETTSELLNSELSNSISDSISEKISELLNSGLSNSISGGIVSKVSSFFWNKGGNGMSPVQDKDKPNIEKVDQTFDDIDGIDDIDSAFEDRLNNSMLSMIFWSIF